MSVRDPGWRHYVDVTVRAFPGMSSKAECIRQCSPSGAETLSLGGNPQVYLSQSWEKTLPKVCAHTLMATEEDVFRH